jgi:hypothetical protein
MRRVGVALAVVLVVGLLGGCGKRTNAVQTVAGAATKTTEAHTAKVSMTMKSDSGPFANGVTEEGGFDFGNRRGRFGFDMAQFGIPGAQGKVEAVFDFSAGLVMYIRMPQLAPELGGKEWMKIDASALGKASGVDFNSIIQNQSSDPTSGLQQLRGATEVTKVGSEVLRGATTTHYRLVVDLDKAVQQTPEAGRAAMQKLMELYTVKTLPAEVWIDGQGRARRYRTTIDTATLKLPAELQTKANPFTGKLTMTMEYFDFGAAVDATPPPADQVTDMNDLLAGVSGSTQFKSVGSSLS